jgi:hypothetical protein
VNSIVGIGRIVTGPGQCSQALSISDGTPISRKMRLSMELQRQIFRPLLFDDRYILGKNLVVEIEGIFDGCVLVEVTAKRNEQPGLSGGLRRRRVQDMKETTFGKRDCQFLSRSPPNGHQTQIQPVSYPAPTELKPKIALSSPGRRSHPRISRWAIPAVIGLFRHSEFHTVTLATLSLEDELRTELSNSRGLRINNLAESA